MAKFTDTTGADWNVEIDGWVWKQFKTRAPGVNPIEVIVTEAMDPADFIDLLWIACEEQIKERDLDERGFAKRIGTGETFDAAFKAFDEACNDFFPQSRRDKLRAAKAATAQALEAMSETALQTLRSYGDGSETPTTTAYT